MRINFFRERLLDGISFGFAQLPGLTTSTPAPVKTESETTPKKFGTKELVENLGISEAQAKLLISGAKGDANAQVTEQELFEEIQKGKVFNTAVRDGAQGDVFDSANYNNKALLDRLDKLDVKTGDIKFNKETKDIAWEAAGAEIENQNPPIERPITAITPEGNNTNNDTTRLALASKLKEEGINIDPAKLTLKAEVKNGELSGDIYSYEHEGKTRYVLVDDGASKEAFSGAGTLRGVSIYSGKEASPEGNITIKGSDGQDIIINKDNYGIPNA